MAEQKKEEKKAEPGHGKSTFFKSAKYLEDQVWRAKFRERAEGGLQNHWIKTFMDKHKFATKGDYSGIILRKRGWITKQHGYKEVSCCGLNTGNSCFDLSLITVILIFLWLFYVLFFWATLAIYESEKTGFLYFGCACQAVNFFTIGCVVIAGYIATAKEDAAAMEKAKMAEESKSADHRI